MKHEHSIEAIAYVEMYVSNIIHSRNFFTSALKCEHVASMKEEETIRFLMKQGNIYFVLSSSMAKDSLLSLHLYKYGDSIKKISFWVKNVEVCFEKAIEQGAKPICMPAHNNGVFTASVEVFNGIEHEFLEGSACPNIPGFNYKDTNLPSPMIFNIDHIASCHPKGSIEHWARFYKNAFSFSENKNEDIYSDESGMHITIMKSPNGKVKLPLVEPSSDKSPLHTYLKYNYGAGVHHIAFETNNIIDAVKHYESNGGELRKAPGQYHEELLISYPEQRDNINKMKPYGIMFEQDDVGILFQIFTKPVVSRPTFFLEFVQREKCEGFGTVNIKALYESLES